MARKRSHGTGSIIKANNGIYYFWWTDAQGQRHKKSLRTRNKEQAHKKAADFEKATSAQDQADVLHQSAKLQGIINTKSLPLNEVWDAFIQTNPGSSKGTLGNYKRMLNDFIEWLKDHRPSIRSFSDIDQETADAYLAYLWESGISANTYNYRRNALGFITKQLSKRYGIRTNVWRNTERKREVKQKRKALTAPQAREFMKLIDDPEQRLPYREELRIVGLLSLFTGMRLIDAVLCKWGSIDLPAGRIEYIPRKTASKGKTALVPILPPLDAALRKLSQGADSDYVLPNVAEVYGRNPDAVQKPLIRLIQEAVGSDGKDNGNDAVQRKVKRSAYGIHSLRHTFASMAAASGVQPAYLARMLGDNITTIQKYYVDVGLGMEILSGFNAAPKMIEAKAKEEPKRAELHQLVDTLPLQAVRNTLAAAKRQQRKVTK